MIPEYLCLNGAQPFIVSFFYRRSSYKGNDFVMHIAIEKDESYHSIGL